MHRLLKGKADAQLSPLRDVFLRNILAVKHNLPLSNRVNAHNSPCQGGLATAIWPCDDYKFAIRNNQIHVVNNILASIAICNCVGDIL